jgi:hypothetical protein
MAGTGHEQDGHHGAGAPPPLFQGPQSPCSTAGGAGIPWAGRSSSRIGGRHDAGPKVFWDQSSEFVITDSLSGFTVFWARVIPGLDQNHRCHLPSR